MVLSLHIDIDFGGYSRLPFPVSFLIISSFCLFFFLFFFLVFLLLRLSSSVIISPIQDLYTVHLAWHLAPARYRVLPRNNTSSRSHFMTRADFWGVFAFLRFCEDLGWSPFYSGGALKSRYLTVRTFVAMGSPCRPPYRFSAAALTGPQETALENEKTWLALLHMLFSKRISISSSDLSEGLTPPRIGERAGCVECWKAVPRCIFLVS